ncbi:unnamed protein product [Owenia fusiformis]|uniref:Transcription initiation factor TFIID subunit 9 n=1 Tax=Owenia fusiformis TaxID=6347 RepID=A0A8J1UCE9_OWEFU|nr:unnamed protein product [Owenia fusiformis]
MASPTKSHPKDSQVMSSILKDMGVVDYEPRVITQMLEFTYKYVTDVLEDAKVYSNHANKKLIDMEDVKLALQCKLDNSFTTPPPRDLLMEVARHRNNTTLPLIKPYTGPRLPPDRYCLAATNYKLKSVKKPRMQVQLQSMSTGGALPSPRLTFNTSLGQVQSGSMSLVSRPTVSYVSKPVNTSSTPTSGPRPVFRMTMGGTPPVQSQLTPSQQSGAITSLLKRKREDDDYDNP